MSDETLQLIDIINPKYGIQVEIDNTGRKVWVNVDGVCRFRGQFVGTGDSQIEVVDSRPRDGFRN